MSRLPLTTLSDSQRRVLYAVVRREQVQEPNFISELVSELGMKAESSLAPTLQRMVRLGVILIQGGGAKGRQRLVLSTEKGRLLCDTDAGFTDANLERSAHWRSPRFTGGLTGPFTRRLLPLLGSIPAGPLDEVIARDETEAVEIDSVLKSQPGDFLLKIKGDSMIGDGILDGDIVLLRSNVSVNPGEIAAVIAMGAGGDCDATLKHIFWYAGDKPVPPSQATEVRLKASNPAYADMVFPAESIRIAGVFRGLIRPGGSTP
ncbi:MAG: S24 family peptidase [Verrucomicrobiota bacterium]